MKKLLRQFLFLIAAAGVASLLFVLLLDELIMPYLVDVPKVRVPSLRGLSVPQAEQRLQRLDLRLSLGDSMFHETVPAGAIIDQDPAAHQRIKKGRRIAVDTSRGRRFYAVPNVRRASLREARLQLEGSRLEVGEIAYVSSASIPEGAVIDLTPSPGTLLSPGTLVDLEISSGPSSLPKRVPPLRGLPIEAVEDTLRKYEMRLGRITNQIDNDQPVGTVLAQSPGPERRAARLTRVDLVVSVQETTATQQDTTAPNPAFPGGLEP